MSHERDEQALERIRARRARLRATAKAKAIVNPLPPHLADAVDGVFREILEDPEVQAAEIAQFGDFGGRDEFVEKMIAEGEKRIEYAGGTLRPEALFGKEGFKAETAAGALVARLGAVAVALEGESDTRLVIYRDGVYVEDQRKVHAVIVGMLGERWRRGHQETVIEVVKGQCLEAGRVVREFGHGGWLTLANGMLHVPDLQFKPFSPEFFAGSRLAVAWDPAAECPAYERWVAGRGLDSQLAGLEEASGIAFWPRESLGVGLRTMFCYGESRSGKGTWLRLMGEVAGPGNRAHVTLHQLTENRFMGAQLVEKIVNLAGDLSSRHVDDLSVFKMLTGDEPITVERKGGQPFALHNKAMFVFAGNEPPSVSENSNAYFNRMLPFEFGVSFAGKENPAVERELMAELPGIFRRWIEAACRLVERGSYLPAESSVSAAFRRASDRVSAWTDEYCVVHYRVGLAPGQSVHDWQVTPGRMLFREFMTWAKEANSRASMRESAFLDRLRRVPGAVEGVRKATNKARGWNISLRDLDAEEPPEDVVEERRRPLRNVRVVADVADESESTALGWRRRPITRR